MKYDPKIHHRRSIRLHGYDYALPGAYFITLCVFNRKCIFGHVVEGRMDENDCGKIVREQWLESAQIRQELALDAFVVMPNHVHGIVWILGPKGEHVLMNGGFTQLIVGASGARPLAERRSALQTPEHRSAPRERGGPSQPCVPIRWPPGRRDSNRRLRAGFEICGINRTLPCGRRIISNVSFATRTNWVRACKKVSGTFSPGSGGGNGGWGVHGASDHTT
jgi:hypothetical protein